jgi:hypothetical protein
MTRPAKGRPLLFQSVSSTSTHWPAYCSSICSSENTPWGNGVEFFLAIFLAPLSPLFKGEEFLSAHSGSRYCHVQLRPETRELAFPELREKYPVASWRKHVELVARRASVLL